MSGVITMQMDISDIIKCRYCLILMSPVAYVVGQKEQLDVIQTESLMWQGLRY